MKPVRIRTITFLLLILWIGSIHAVNYGETFEVGTTYWHTQQNSTVGKIISRDELGGTHLVWTKTFDADQSRWQVYYNFCDDDEGDIIPIDACQAVDPRHQRSGCFGNSGKFHRSGIASNDYRCFNLVDRYIHRLT